MLNILCANPSPEQGRAATKGPCRARTHIYGRGIQQQTTVRCTEALSKRWAAPAQQQPNGNNGSPIEKERAGGGPGCARGARGRRGRLEARRQGIHAFACNTLHGIANGSDLRQQHMCRRPLSLHNGLSKSPLDARRKEANSATQNAAQPWTSDGQPKPAHCLPPPPLPPPHTRATWGYHTLRHWLGSAGPAGLRALAEDLGLIPHCRPKESQQQHGARPLGRL